MSFPSPLDTKDNRHLRWHRATIGFLILSTLIRLMQLPAFELVPDEAYYWDWSRRLALGYYDQGPMIAYVIRLTTALFGTNEFAVRIGVLVASLGTLICCYTLARRIFSPLAGFLTVVLLGVTPLMEVGSLIATYDPLLVVFWALAVLFLERGLFAPTRKEQQRAWIGAGIATGFGLLSKHTMLLLVPCLILFLLLSPPHRFWLLRFEPYAAFGIVLLLYSGVLWWNAQNHWWTFGHLLFLAAKSFHSPLRRFGDFVGSQALLLGPLLFLGAIGTGWLAWKGWSPTEAEEDSQRHEGGRQQVRFLVCMGLPVFALFCLMTLKAKVQGNWGPCAWLSTTMLWAGWLSVQVRRAPRVIWTLTGATLAASLFLTVGAISPDLRMALGVRLKPDEDLSNTAYGWRETAQQLQRVREEMERETGRRPFLASNGYQYTALMAFYLPDHPETFDMVLRSRLTMYCAHLDRLKARLGEDAIYINSNQVEDPELRQIFERVEWGTPYPVERKPYYQKPIREIYFARCYRYRRFQGLEWAVGG